MTDSQDVQGLDQRRQPIRRLHWSSSLFFAAIVGIFSATAAYLLIPAKYVSSSVLFIDASPQPVVDKARYETEDFDTIKRTQMFKATSPVVLETALNEPIENPKLAESNFKTVGDLSLLKTHNWPVDWMESKITTFAPEKEFFEIRMTHHTEPLEMAEIVNAVTRVYLRDFANDYRVEQMGRIEQLKKLAVDLESQRKHQREQIERWKQALGARARGDVLLSELANREIAERLYQKYIEQSIKLFELENQLQISEKSPADGRSMLHVEGVEELVKTIVVEQLHIEDLNSEKESLKAKIQKLEEQSQNGDDSSLQAAKIELQQLEQKLTIAQEKVEPVLLAAYRNLIEFSYNQDRVAIQEQIGLTIANIGELRSHLNTHSPPVKLLKKLGFDGYVKSNELKDAEKVLEKTETRLEKVRDQIELAEIEARAPDRIKLHHKAEVPRITNYTFLYLRSAIIGFAVSLLTFLILLLFRRKLVW